MNFIFNEAARAMVDGTGIDWVNEVFEAVLYENLKGDVHPYDTWADFAPFIPTNGVEELTNRSIVSYSGSQVFGGGCKSDPVQFVDVSLVNGSFVPGLIIKRQSDDLLVCHIDNGIEGVSPFDGGTFGGSGDLLSIIGGDNTQSHTFWLVPDANHGAAWFRP